MITTSQRTGLRSVMSYRDAQGCTCDRCGTFIKMVVRVETVDGVVARYGSECINKILRADNSLLAVWRKNERRLKRLVEVEASLANASEWRKGGEYYGSGMHMIADRNGQDIGETSYRLVHRHPHCPAIQGPHLIEDRCHYLFHPDVDLTKNAQSKYPLDGRATWDGPNTPENYVAKCRSEAFLMLARVRSEIEKTSRFLARVLEKGLLASSEIKD